MNKKEAFYLNTLFPQQILILRHYIINIFLNKDKNFSTNYYSNLKEFYQEGKMLWNIIVSKGDSILELKSILEKNVKELLEDAATKYIS